ncbi:hypothetical protein C2S51_026160 [Perilla frutescens var. frutescens]|nr:hypothetical protein C2S51_026160 [Perilla frutescens var. frutescens]
MPKIDVNHKFKFFSSRFLVLLRSQAQFVQGFEFPNRQPHIVVRQSNSFESGSIEEAKFMAGNKPHILAMAFPAQGHLKPLMSLCRQIAKQGIKVTFVNAQTVHDKIVAAAANISPEEGSNMVLISIPDAFEPDDHPFVLLETLLRTMPESLPDLIEKINSSNPNEKISCVIADLGFGCIFDVAEMVGAEFVGFSASSAASFALMLHIPNLIRQGNLDADGTLKKGDLIRLSDDIPAWIKDELPWCIPNDLKSQKIVFECMKSYQDANKAKWVLWNSCYELEPSACDLLPNFLPIGPLHLREKSCSDSSNFYPEDTSCLSWLDDKPDGSVIYVSFGSSSIFYENQQLNELALGLELSGRAFLWVVSRDLANGSRVVYPDNFLERVSEFGKIVEWAPQNDVLSHPAVACFVSHCGWNSTLEGVSKGVPYLCWPYFADQFHNESYICDKWEIGLRIDRDEGGMRSRYEIKKKIDMLFSNNKYKENAFKLQEMCANSIGEGGSSSTNLDTFLDHVRKCKKRGDCGVSVPCRGSPSWFPTRRVSHTVALASTSMVAAPLVVSGTLTTTKNSSLIAGLRRSVHSSCNSDSRCSQVVFSGVGLHQGDFSGVRQCSSNV